MQKTKQRHADMSWRHSPRGGYRTSTIYRQRSIFVLVVVLSAGRCYHIFAGRKAPFFPYGHRVGAWRICFLPAEGRRVSLRTPGRVAARTARYTGKGSAFSVRTSERLLGVFASCLRKGAGFSVRWFAGERQPAALAAVNRRVAAPRHLRRLSRSRKKEKL